MCDCAGADLGAARDTWSTLKLTRPPAFLHSAVKLLISHPALLTSAQCPARLVNTMALTTYECFQQLPALSQRRAQHIRYVYSALHGDGNLIKAIIKPQKAVTELNKPSELFQNRGLQTGSGVHNERGMEKV